MISNLDESIKANGIDFLIKQRNIGFADNDGKWIVSQLPELYWGTVGNLRQRRSGTFLGVFDTRAAADAAIASAAPQPTNDKMVL